MDFFDGSNIDIEKEKRKNKMLIKIIIIALIIVFLLSLCTLGAIYYLKNKELKLYIDGKKTSFSEDLFVIEDGQVYVSIKDISSKIGYTVNNGEYKNPYSENTDRCYLDNGYETVSYIKDADSIYKVLTEDKKASEYEYEYYKIEKPVQLINNKLYVSYDGLEKGCNLSFSYTEKNNTIRMYTLPYLVDLYSKKIEDSALNERDVSYTNKKAVLYGLMIVKNSSDKYGLKNLNNESIIGEKYKTITFEENSQEFVVETDNGKFGIITGDGETKINPEYDSIKIMDKNRGLYVVSNNKKYGVINKNGKVVVFLEYDKIGIEQGSFSADDIDNPYLLYDKCIPVEKDEKWGLLDLNGNTILPIDFDGLGCTKNTSKDSLAQNLLLIPEYEAIVVCKNNLYGIYNSSGKELIQALVTDMYSITSGGEKKYYLTYQGITIDTLDYLLNVGKIQPVNGGNNSSATNNGSDNSNNNNSNNSNNNNNNNNGNSNNNSNNINSNNNNSINNADNSENINNESNNSNINVEVNN